MATSGPKRGKATKKKKGTKKDVWNAAQKCKSLQVRAAFAEVECDWLQLAYETHARRFAPPGNAKEWQKQYSYLRMRGFQSDHIRSVLKGDPPVSD